MSVVEDCARHLREAARRHPRYPDIWYRLGIVLNHLQRLSAALEAFDTALDIHPQYFEAGVSRSFLLAETGRVPEGFRVLRAIHVRSPDDFETVYALGTFCMRNGWKDAGIAQLRRAQSMRPCLPLAMASLANALREAEESAPAERLERRVDELLEKLPTAGTGNEGSDALVPGPGGAWENPYLTRIHSIVADYLRECGDGEGAERELRAANMRRPGHAALMVDLGRTLLARDGLEEALEWFTGAATVDEGCHQAFFEMSFAHARGDDLERAVEALRTAVALRPLFPDYRYHLGTLLEDLGHADEAIEELERVFVLSPSYSLNVIHLANAYIDCGDVERAIGLLEASSCRTWPEALILAARAHRMAGRPDEARRLAEAALSVDASNGDARLELQKAT